MKEILIGRDAETNKLRITVDGKSSTFGAADSVPRSVSQQHVKLTIGDDGSLLLTNLNVDNDTFVNHRGIEAKYITHGDRITLGGENYKLTWDILDPFIPKMVDITPLHDVWNEYMQRNLDIRKRQQQNNVLAGVPMLFTVGGGLVSTMLPDDLKKFGVIITVIAFITMLYGFYLRSTDKSIEKQEQLRKWFQQNYTCPSCGHFMGNQDYDLIIQNNGCPYCRTQWMK